MPVQEDDANKAASATPRLSTVHNISGVIAASFSQMILITLMGLRPFDSCVSFDAKCWRFCPILGVVYLVKFPKGSTWWVKNSQQNHSRPIAFNFRAWKERRLRELMETTCGMKSATVICRATFRKSQMSYSGLETNTACSHTSRAAQLRCLQLAEEKCNSRGSPFYNLDIFFSLFTQEGRAFTHPQ